MAHLTNKQIFPGLAPEHFQHPLDISTSEALKKVPLLPMFISWLNSKSLEHLMRQRNLESTIRLSPRQGGSIYEAFEYACHILDIENPPELFIKNQPFFNAYAMGTKRHSIVLTSSLVDAVNEEELLAVIGHGNLCPPRQAPVARLAHRRARATTAFGNVEPGLTTVRSFVNV